MSKQNVLGIIVSLVVIVGTILTLHTRVYSYVQSNYVQKAVMDLVLDRLDRIEGKLDKLLAK